MGKGARPIRHVVVAGIKWQEAGSSGVKVSNMARGEGRSHPEETTMSPTWNALPAAWTDVIRVVLVTVVLFVAACTGAAHSPERGDAGPMVLGDGDDGSGM